jgi:hypothetical protein
MIQISKFGIRKLFFRFPIVLNAFSRAKLRKQKPFDCFALGADVCLISYVQSITFSAEETNLNKGWPEDVGDFTRR